MLTSKCENCIHNQYTGCMMLDCIRHPNSERYATLVMTNTFVDRFVDRRKITTIMKGGKNETVKHYT
jgi:hypothetical protein